jgi:hypothetical protein
MPVVLESSLWQVDLRVPHVLAQVYPAGNAQFPSDVSHGDEAAECNSKNLRQIQFRQHHLVGCDLLHRDSEQVRERTLALLLVWSLLHRVSDIVEKSMSSLGKASQVKVNDDFMSTPSEVQTFIRK